MEQQLSVRELGFAEGLKELADDLHHMSDGGEPEDHKLREWAGWLSERADEVRTTSKYNQPRT